jgi:TPR repeat protein
MCSLGVYLLAGVGVARDAGRGFDLVRAAADRGVAGAHFHVGRCREFGDGARRKFSEAAREYGIAADDRYAPAQCALGRCRYYGIGIERSVRDACALFKLAAEQGDARGCYYAGLTAAFGEGPGDPIELWRRSAGEGDPLGLCALGIARARAGECVEAFELFGRAADQDDAGGYFNRGCCFVRGDGTQADVARAYECFRKCCALGGLYWETKPGANIAYRRADGLNLIDLSQQFREEARADVSAAVNYGWCQFLGAVVPKDTIGAVRAFRAAAEQKHPGGMFCLALALSDGAEAQSAEATQWFTEAALWNVPKPASAASSRSQAILVKPAKPKVSKPQPGKQSFLVPGKRFQVAKEQKERRKQVKKNT